MHLVRGGDVGRLLGDRAGETFRFLEALTVERLGRLGQPLRQPSTALLADGVDELGRDLGVERLQLAPLRPGAGVVARSVGLDRLVAHRTVVDPGLERAVLDLLAFQLGVARRARAHGAS